MEHHDLKPDYPSFAEFRAASTVLVAHLRGTEQADTGCLVKAAWVGIGFAGSFVPDGPPPVYQAQDLSDEDKAAYLEAATFATTAAATDRTNWLIILQIMLELLSKFLGK